MSFMNAFFRVERPFRFYRQFGLSPSNTWIGSSRVISNVYHALNAQPGDEMHALVGGLFVADRVGPGGTPSAAPARLSPPKPPLEKSYGTLPDSDTLRAMAKAGLVREIPRSEARPLEYAAVRNAAGRQLQEYHPEVVELMPSPEMVAFRESISSFALGLDDYGAEVRWQDHVENPVVRLNAVVPDLGRLMIERAYIPGYHVLDIPDAVAPPWPEGTQDQAWSGRTLKVVPKGVDVADLLVEVSLNLDAVFSAKFAAEQERAGPRP